MTNAWWRRSLVCRRLHRIPRAVVLALTLALACAPCAAAVLVMHVEGVIDPPTASYLERCIHLATEKDAQALVMRLDTPGGSLAATEDMVTAMLNSRVPVVVYVAPAGAHAMSAGTFITLAAHVAAMAPGTNIGAATPVFMGGQEMADEMKRKVVSHAVSMIRSIAEERQRNVDWAEQAVRKALSAPASEAVKKRVVDLLADDDKDLLRKLDGRSVDLGKGRKVTLRTKGVPVQQVPQTLSEKFLHALAHPEIAYILLTLGVLGIIAELNHPGALFPGITGAICLLLAFYSLSVLSVNFVGVALILLGLGLLVADLFVTAHGILTVGGLISFVVGSIMLTSNAAPEMRLGWHVIVSMTTLTGGLFLLIISLGLRAQKRRIATGMEGLVGSVGQSRTALNPRGQVFVVGELWRARAEGEHIPPSEEVEVIGVDGLTLQVRRKRPKE
jgi:membrane-bound serine protease (ClpP class)